ncbi:MAG: glycosyltransferase family 4 protein [Fuerstiella sp.]
MKTAHIITRLIIGGAQENTLYNVDDQHHLHGDQVCLITGPGLGPEGTLEQKAIARGLDLKVLPELKRSLNPLQDFRCYLALKRLLSEYRPDIVHTHSSKAGILGRRAAYALGIPCVHTVHGAAFHYGQPSVLYHSYRMAEKLAAKWCHKIITVCDAMQQQYLEAGIGSPAMYKTIYSGMEVDHFLTPKVPPQEIRKQLGLQPDDIVVGKVARLFNLKGHKYLVEAASAIVKTNPKVRFLLVGDGILQDQLQQRVTELGLQNHVLFAGLVAPDEVPHYLHAMDMLVHTSEWEGLARVLPQALICAKPIVSFDIDGAPEVCINDETGYLVPPRSIDLLSEAIEKLVNDQSLRLRLGQNGKQKFTDLFRHQTMTELVRQVYKDVLDHSA